MTRRTSQAGQSAVEFALILPILLLLLMGVFDFGRAFYYYSVVANAAREGARAGIYSTTTTDASIRSEVHRYAVGLNGLTDGNIAIARSGSGTSAEVRVTVSYQYDAVTPIIDRFLPGGAIMLRSSSTMQVE
jgi:Flp pilus assembly protein TadG